MSSSEEEHNRRPYLDIPQFTYDTEGMLYSPLDDMDDVQRYDLMALQSGQPNMTSHERRGHYRGHESFGGSSKLNGGFGRGHQQDWSSSILDTNFTDKSADYCADNVDFSNALFGM